ncbi:hypothetical protein NT6N_31640 [Oceaniferula spumae]|uniref:Uncharacterized protein n=1 Tax=Oceaniferula spumae TaxID=2979115 RepID=A0AAT9FQ46_9BACT
MNENETHNLDDAPLDDVLDWLKTHSENLRKKYSSLTSSEAIGCAYLGCGRISIRQYGGVTVQTIGYVSELAVYKTFMRIPAELRVEWSWEQGRHCNSL